jgi:hypothetical protein
MVQEIYQVKLIYSLKSWLGVPLIGQFEIKAEPRKFWFARQYFIF